VGMSDKDLNNACSLFVYSLDGRLRPRYFYALLKHQLGGRYRIITMMSATNAAFVAMIQGGTKRDRASKEDMARYQKLAISAKFVAWHERQQHRLYAAIAANSLKRPSL